MGFRRAGLIAVVVLVVAPAAPARSVPDPHIGWTTAQRRALHLPRVREQPCHRHITRAMAHLQNVVDKRGDPLEAIRALMGYRGGNAWYDACDGGRLGIGIPPRGARHVGAIQALLARRGLTRQVRLFAVRSTYRELSDAQEALEARFAALVDWTLLITGIDTTRNAVLVELARPVSAEDRARVRAAALAAPVNVVVHDVGVSEFSVVFR